MSTLLRVLAGLIGWAAGFFLLYGLHGIACAGGWASPGVGPLDLQRLVLGFVWLGSVVAIAIWALHLWRTPRGAIPLLHRLALGSAVAGVFAMIVSGLPIVTTAPCRVDSSPGTIAAAGCCAGIEHRSAPRAAVAAGKALPVQLHANMADLG